MAVPRDRFAPVVGLFVLWLLCGPAAGEDRCTLATGGKATMGVVVGRNASPQTIAHARTLADYLGRITGAGFSVSPGDGKAGIAVGLPGDFPALGVGEQFQPKNFLRRDEYLLRSGTKGLLVIGATPMAVSHAVWDLLYRIGHRQFFVGDVWQVVPRRQDLSIAVDTFEKPDYLIRGLSSVPNWGPMTQMKADWATWMARNRMQSSLKLFHRHIYGRIIRKNRRAFAKHPEYLALFEGKRQGTKFCLSNRGLRKLCVDWALRYFRNRPRASSVPMEPSDGGRWCQCAPCAEMGSVSDRVVTLANEAAEAVRKQFGDRYITLYAYNVHGDPPTIRVHRNVVPYIATAWLRGRTPEDMLDGWRRQGARLMGIYEYPAPFSRTRNLPARSRIASPGYLRNTLPVWHGKGVRAIYGNAGYSVGETALGLYLASRVLWNVREAERLDQITEDFLAKAFGPAAAPMRRFFTLTETDATCALKKAMTPNAEVSAETMHGMYDALRDAKKLADSPAIHARLNQLILYARYVDLQRQYRQEAGQARQHAFDRLVTFVFRVRRLPIVSAYWFFREAVAGSERGVTVRLTGRELVNDELFSLREIEAFLLQMDKAGS